MNTALISLEDVSKRFGSHQAVDGVSLDVHSGESVVIIGPSGCGKTTFLRLIAGLEVPDRGEIRLNGERVAASGNNVVPPHQRGMGFVFQDLALWPHLSVRESLEFVLRAGRRARSERDPLIEEALRLAQIERLSGRYPHELSGGEQQRAALARALVGRPRVLLLDEPFSNLNPDLRATLRAELVRLQRDLAFTSLYVTHDPADGTALSARVVEMSAGRIVSTGAGNGP